MFDLSCNHTEYVTVIEQNDIGDWPKLMSKVEI